MRRQRILRVVVMITVIVVIVGCDQGTKTLARSRLGNGTVVSLFGGILVMSYVENQGAFLSLGERLPRVARGIVFIAVPLAVLAGIVLSVARKKNVRGLFAAGLACVAGGGLGNLLDRVFHGGRVGDFLTLGVGSVRTGIFNVADMCIMLGCLLLVLDSGRNRGNARS